LYSYTSATDVRLIPPDVILPHQNALPTPPYLVGEQIMREGFNLDSG